MFKKVDIRANFIYITFFNKTEVIFILPLYRMSYECLHTYIIVNILKLLL